MQLKLQGMEGTRGFSTNPFQREGKQKNTKSTEPIHLKIGRKRVDIKDRNTFFQSKRSETKGAVGELGKKCGSCGSV